MVNILTKQKSGQLTIFMLLGLTMLIIFSLILIMARTQTGTKAETEIEKSVSSILHSEVISSYISSCLENSLKQGVTLIGQQGGFIYKEQEGSIFNQDIPYTKITTNNENYTYLILQPEIPLLPPLYPCSEEPCNFQLNKTLFPELLTYYFGRFGTLPRLYKYVSTATGEKKLINNSIQNQLEQFIYTKTLNCIDIDTFRQRPELAGANITLENASIELIFSQKEINALLNYPLRIILQENPPVIELLKFDSQVEVRLIKIYEAIKDMIIKDTIYIDYDLLENTKDGFYVSDIYDKEETTKFLAIRKSANISITSIDNPPGTDLITIQDSNSLIDGKPFIFRFARQNRRPILEPLKDVTLNTSQNYEIPVSAADPDEDNLIFTYVGGATTNPFNISLEGYYQVRTTTSDSYLEDYQDINITVCNQFTNSINTVCLEICNADLECNNLIQNTSIPSFCPSYPKSYYSYTCNSTCTKQQTNLCGCASPEPCHGKEGYTWDTQQWCYGGGTGCKERCTGPISYPGATVPPIGTKINDSEFICGCPNPGAACETVPYDGILEKTCNSAGQCV